MVSKATSFIHSIRNEIAPNKFKIDVSPTDFTLVKNIVIEMLKKKLFTGKF